MAAWHFYHFQNNQCIVCDGVFLKIFLYILFYLGGGAFVSLQEIDRGEFPHVFFLMTPKINKIINFCFN